MSDQTSQLAHVAPSVRNEAPEPDRPPSGSGAAPTCAWPLGCDNPIEERDVCGYHADKVRDLWADFDRGEMKDGH